MPYLQNLLQFPGGFNGHGCSDDGVQLLGKTEKGKKKKLGTADKLNPLSESSEEMLSCSSSK